MKPETDAGPVKAKPAADSAKTKALRSVVEALQDGDVDSAAAALGLAVKACMAEYEEVDDGAE